MHITSADATELFVPTPDGPAQLLRVSTDPAVPAEPVTVTAGGTVLGIADAGRTDVPLTGLIGARPGEVVGATVVVGDATAPVRITVAEPGWTVWMIPHFHYDPVWWNTQAAYTATWDELGEEAQRTRMAFQQTGFALVDAHLAAARRDPDYRFVLAEVDYLKPYWDARPEQRALLRRLLAEDRLEIMGGTYNEPNTNLTTAETTARNFVHGAGFQRGVLGADPHTAWQLDVFGHDPQFPGMAADAGLTSSSWARGPHHQWGPMLTTHDASKGWGDPSVMQFAAEFDWISPSGRGVLTHYMPAHYSAGWQIDSQADLAGAEQAVYQLFLLLKRVAATRNILLPVGTDYTPPSKWVTEIQRHWNATYAWPRFECAIPRQFFAAVRQELAAAGRRPAAQTRDMNPVYTGKDVSYIDTKQAQRHAEGRLVDAEMFAAFAALHGAGYPHAALDKAWRQLVYGAHHDAITGSESDQVYLDLLTGWREAYDIGHQVLGGALDHLAARLDAPAGPGAVPVAVFNPSAWDRTDLVTVPVTLPEGRAAGSVEVVAPDGRVVPGLVEDVRRRPDGGLATARVSFLAEAPGIGHSAGWQVRPAEGLPAGWVDDGAGTRIESERYLLEVDPERGGCVSRLHDKRTGREVLRAGGLGNELVMEQEYPEHPVFHEGPWHLVPTGQARRASAAPADSVQVQHSPLGRRITVTGRLGGVRYTQRITLWDGLDRIDCRTTLDGFTGADELVRVRWAADVPGALPVSDVGNAVVGRGFGFPRTDTAEHPWTLDNPAVTWFALSSTARVRVTAPDGTAHQRALGVAELVAPDPAADDVRALAVALVGQGVTATTSAGSGPRYGTLAVDSNLPDVRIAVGSPEENPFVAALLGAVDESYRVELDKQLAATGTARVWVPAARPLGEVWRPSADLTGTRDLPVLVLAGAGEPAAVAGDLADAVIDVHQVADAQTPGEGPLDDYTVGLLNTGMPSFVVEPDGALNLSVLRSCTGWPSGVWIDPPRRTAPDGSNFQQQHWTHHYDYALVTGAGDWRAAGLVRSGHELNHPLHTSSVAGTGDRPARDRFLDVGDGVLVGAVKAAGNPLAEGRAPGPVDGITVRLVEPAGAAVWTALTPAFPVTGAAWTDLLERPLGEDAGTDGPAVPVRLTPMQIRTLRLAVAPVTASGDPLAADTEPRQPVYTRYWLDNTGPAPRGNLPVTVHVEPQVVRTAEPFELTVRVASDRTDAAAAVPVRLAVPDGWRAEPAQLRLDVAPGGHRDATVRITPPDGLADGSWWVRAQAESGGQLLEDVVRVLAGPAREPELRVEVRGPQPLRPGEHGRVEVTLSSAARSQLAARVQLIGPWHTWELLPEWDAGASLTPGGRQLLSLPVEVPPGTPPGAWWLVVKVAAAGLLHYSAPVELQVLAP